MGQFIYKLIINFLLITYLFIFPRCLSTFHYMYSLFSYSLYINLGTPLFLYIMIRVSSSSLGIRANGSTLVLPPLSHFLCHLSLLPSEGCLPPTHCPLGPCPTSSCPKPPYHPQASFCPRNPHHLGCLALPATLSLKLPSLFLQIVVALQPCQLMRLIHTVVENTQIRVKIFSKLTNFT